jgi:hypothetical protein
MTKTLRLIAALVAACVCALGRSLLSGLRHLYATVDLNIRLNLRLGVRFLSWVLGLGLAHLAAVQ